MASFPSLNDTCLYEIFKFCSLESQYNLSKTCQRFKTIVEDIWRNNWKELKVSGNKTGIELHIEDEDLNKLTLHELESIFELIHPTIEVLEYNVNSEKMLELLQKYSFPNLRKFVFGVHILNSLGEEDFTSEDPRLIYRVMVIITKFKLKSLKLNFYEGPELKEPSPKGNFKHFGELEELLVNENEIVLFRNALSSMTKLKKLSLHMIDEDLDGVLKVGKTLAHIPGKQVVELTTCRFNSYDAFDDYIETIDVQLREFRSLRKLTIMCLFWEDIFAFAAAFPQINHFVLTESKITLWKLIHILITGQQLESIELKECWSKSGPLILDVDAIVKRRQKPIIINIHNEWPLGEDDEPVVIELTEPTEFIKIVSIPTEMVESHDFYEYILESK